MKKENSENKMVRGRVLVVDDETQVCKVLAGILTRAGLDVRIANNGYDALKIAESKSCSVAIVDLKMPGLSGMETIRRLKEVDPDMETIIFTGYPSLESSLDAIEHHVFGYLSKPVERHVMLRMVERAIERRQLIVENRNLMLKLRAERDRLRDEVVAAKRGIGLSRGQKR